MKARQGSVVRRRRALPVRDAILGALVIASLVLLVVAFLHRGGVIRNSVAPLAVSKVAFIGDSYIEGTPIGGAQQSNITVLLAQRFGWVVTNTAVSGTGYTTAAGRSYESLQLPRVEAVRPQLVIVFGSLNDMGKGEVDVTASRLYADLKAGLPGTRIVVVGPAWIDGSPPPVVLTTRDQVRRAAAAAGLPFVDPIAEGWFAGNAENLIGADHVHPTDTGHAHMAALLGDDLLRLNALAK